MSSTQTTSTKRKQPEAQKPAWSGKYEVKVNYTDTKGAQILFSWTKLANLDIIRYFKRRRYRKRSYSTFKKARSYWRLRGRYSRKNRGYSSRGGSWRRYRRIRKSAKRFRRRVQQIGRKDHALRVQQRLTGTWINTGATSTSMQVIAFSIGDYSTFSAFNHLVTDWVPQTTTSVFLQKLALTQVWENRSNMIQSLDVYYFKVKKDITATEYANILAVLNDDNGVGDIPPATYPYLDLFTGYIAQTYLKRLSHKTYKVLPQRSKKFRLTWNAKCRKELNYDTTMNANYRYRRGNLICIIKPRPALLQMFEVTDSIATACTNWVILAHGYCSWRKQGQMARHSWYNSTLLNTGTPYQFFNEFVPQIMQCYEID